MSNYPTGPVGYGWKDQDEKAGYEESFFKTKAQKAQEEALKNARNTAPPVGQYEYAIQPEYIQTGAMVRIHRATNLLKLQPRFQRTKGRQRTLLLGLETLTSSRTREASLTIGIPGSILVHREVSKKVEVAKRRSDRASRLCMAYRIPVDGARYCIVDRRA